MTWLYEQRTHIDLITVLEEVDRRDQLQRAVGRGYLTELARHVPTAGHVEHYARIVERASTFRRLIAAGGRIMRIAQRPGIESENALSEAEAELIALSQGRNTSGLTPVPDI